MRCSDDECLTPITLANLCRLLGINLDLFNE